MGWKRKWAKDTLKALLPLQGQLKELTRRVVPEPDTKPAPPLADEALEQGLTQVCLVKQAVGALSGRVLLDLGVGRYPTIPLLFHVAGVERIILTDIERTLDARTFMSAVGFLLERQDRVASGLGVAVEELRRRLDFEDALPTEPAAALELLLKQAGMQYHVPFMESSVATDSVDIVTSRAVLEHIPPEKLDTLLLGFERLLKPDGIMCHIVDNSDPWQAEDNSISPVNFLKHDDARMWALGLNKHNYRNRLRHSEYVELFERAGYEVIEARGEADPAALEALKALPLSERYRGRAHQDLAILTSFFVVQNARAVVLQSLRGPQLRDALGSRSP